MLPPHIDEGVLSAAERRIFGLLQTDPGTEGWTVLHSLGLARRGAKPFGEIDFVVVVPGEGIVCLEVKGGRVSCTEGVWRTVDRYGDVSEFTKSPFMQARDSMFALRRTIQQHFGSTAVESRCPIGCAVVLPDVDCPPITPEFERTDVIDCDDLRGPISACIKLFAQQRLRQFQPKRGVSKHPTVPEAKSIVGYLRPDFDRVMARSVSIDRGDAKLLGLTQEQYQRLDELAENPRCFFEGAAGTGKTLLAIEYARRAAAEGARVGLVCFNRLLGDWLKQQVDDTQITAGTWHSVARRFIMSSAVRDELVAAEKLAQQADNWSSLFQETYPLLGEIALDELGDQFDVLVVDEAQDLGNQHALDFLNRTLLGGFTGGRWAVFGDFTRQALYGSGMDHAAALSRFSGHFVRAKLTLNCRNTQRIALETSMLAGFANPPFRIGQEQGLPVEYRYWGTHNDLKRALAETVRSLTEDGIAVSDLVILSPRRLANSALADVQSVSGFAIGDMSSGGASTRDRINFFTVQSFKGLESRVVILVDVDHIEGDEPQSMLYVGMSRARNLLVLMLNESARSSLNRRIRDALAKEVT